MYTKEQVFYYNTWVFSNSKGGKFGNNTEKHKKISSTTAGGYIDGVRIHMNFI